MLKKSPTQMITSYLEICLVCVAYLLYQWCVLVIFPLYSILLLFCSALLSDYVQWATFTVRALWIYLLVCLTMHFCVMFSISLAWLFFVFFLSFYFRCARIWEVKYILYSIYWFSNLKVSPQECKTMHFLSHSLSLSSQWNGFQASS